MANGINNHDRGVGVGQGIENVSEGSDIQGWRRKMLPRDDGPEELATTTEVLEEEDVTEVSTTTTDASIEE